MLEIARATSRIEIAAAVNADPIIFFICAPLSAEIPLHLPSDSRYARRRCAALIGAIAYHRRSRCIGRAWFEELATGRARSLQELAKRDDISWRYIRRHVRRFYVVNELNATVTAFSYDPVTGQIGKVLQTISTEPAGYDGPHSTAEIAVHPSGKFLYASNRGHNSFVGYRIDPSTGLLPVIGFAHKV